MLRDDDTATATNVPPEANSRKDRVAISLQLEVVGVDLDCRDFVEQARTKMVSRNGAAIVINRLLAPEQTLTLKRAGAHQEAEVRIIGQIGSETGGNVYGVSLVDPSVDIWGIDFPPGDGDETLIKVLLECPICHTRQIALLHEFELRVLEATKNLSRRCPKCRDITLWKQSAYDVPSEAEAVPEPGPAGSALGEAAAARKRRVNRRKQSRLRVELKGCILFGGQETTIEIADMSKGGVRFRSRRDFAQGILVRAAVPYNPGAANIFVAARITWCRSLPSGTTECGLKYVKE